MHTDTTDLQRLADDIDRSGMGTVETAVAEVVDRAHRAGADPVVLSVLADPAEPEIARARAFGMIAAHLMHRPVEVAPALVAVA